jgi:hypothetical protein
MRLAILIHEHDDFESSGYLLPLVAHAWRAKGFDVVVLAGTDHPVDADVCFAHVDLTRVPEAYTRFAKRFPRTINVGCTDISKRVVSLNLVRKGDGYDGPVIVKTDRNCGGLKEALAARRSGIVRRTLRSVHRRLPWMLRAELPGKDYPIFDSPREVPWAVWHNPWLVVERFRPQERDGLYWLNSWHFLGDRETHTERWATSKLVTVSSLKGRKFIEPKIPDVIRQRRRELGSDFGKFDFTINAAGEATLLDANRTPTNSTLSPEEHTKQAEHLAAGLESLLR